MVQKQQITAITIALNVEQLLLVDNEIYGAMVADNFQQNNQNSNHMGYGGQGALVEDGMAWSQTNNTEFVLADIVANRLWAKYFSSGNRSYIHTRIPGNWANFFIVQLLNLANFNWTRNLLISLAPNLDCPEFGQIDFAIPPNCPEHDMQCLIDARISKEIPPKKRNSKRTAQVVVESEVRRSPRIQNSKSGFKHTTTTEKKCCLPCCVNPPTLKKEAIKKIAINLCGMEETEISDELLQAKKQKSLPVARARIVVQDEERNKRDQQLEEMPEDPVEAGQSNDRNERHNAEE
jgi:hypothetical protein